MLEEMKMPSKKLFNKIYNNINVGSTRTLSLQENMARIGDLHKRTDEPTRNKASVRSKPGSFGNPDNGARVQLKDEGIKTEN